MAFTFAVVFLVSGILDNAASSNENNGTATVNQQLRALKVNMKMMTDCLTFTMNGLDTRLEQFKSRLDQLEIQYEQQEELTARRVHSLEQRLILLQSKQSQLESQTGDTETDVNRLRSTVSRTDRKVNQVQSKVNTLYSERQQLKNAVFSARGIHAYQDRPVNLNGGDRLIFHHINNNPGGHYSTTTGKYTCPVSGVYFFHYSVYGYNIKHYVLTSASAKLVKDGTHLVEIYFVNSGSEGIYNTLSNAMVLNCNAGEQVWVESHHNYNRLFNWDGLNMFSGFLISVA